MLVDFLPLESYSRNAVTLRSIFAESGVGKYLDGRANKRQRLQKGFECLFRYHEKLPKMIMRKVIPAAIEYRRYKRNPLTRDELDRLAACLSDLGIDMKAEIAAIKLDESLPPITAPPAELLGLVRQYGLHQAMITDPLTLFEDGHYNEAVRKACERFEDRVRELSGINSHGRDLMARAFSDGKLISIDRFEPENRQDFADGYKLLAMGVMAAVRNAFSHGDEERRSPEECFEMLLFINWMFRALNER